jgi:hypothetical protein
MPSLVATWSRPLAIVVRCQLSRAVVVQRHCHAAAWAAGKRGCLASRSIRARCPNHPPPTWHPGGRDCQYYDGAETDAQASVGKGEETPSGPIATSIIRRPPPSPSFGKTTSGILVLVACRLSDPPPPLQMLLPLSSVQLVLQERSELPPDDHVREGHVTGYREPLDEQSPQRLRLAEEAQSEVIPR